MIFPVNRLGAGVVLLGCSVLLVGGCRFDKQGKAAPAPPVCGNHELELGETCDDGNDLGGDGCSATCQLETSCGDGTQDPAEGEVCDDGNTVGGDGCSADCLSDETCGNGITDEVVWEMCDDGNTVSGDGCSADCSSDEICGNGKVDSAQGEECDDGNPTLDDGCNALCRIEPGYSCELEPSVCEPVCGDGYRVGSEGCDDGGTDPGDGCDDLCQVEQGWVCPGACEPICGDGLALGGEQCDDGNLINGDGCEANCTPTLDCFAEQYNGHDYMFCIVPRDWGAADSACDQIGYHLVKIDDAAENTWVTDTAATHATGPWWMGANDQVIEAFWVWHDSSVASGSPMWAPGEPSNSGGNEDCGAISEPTVPPYFWNDADCSHLKPCVCELP